MSQWLFEKTLLNSRHRYLQPLSEFEQITEDDVTRINELLQVFADSLSDEDGLGTYFDAFCEHFELDEEDRETFAEILFETATQLGGEGTDQEIKEALKQFHQHPMPKPETRYPNQVGMTPLAGEDGIKAILKTASDLCIPRCVRQLKCFGGKVQGI